MFAVSKIWRNEELILRTDFHQLKRFGPTFDHTADRKGRRLATFVGTVELGAVDQRAAIIYRHGVGALRLRAVAFFEHFVLQTAGGRLHAVLLFVVGQKFFGVSCVLFSRLGLFLLHIFFERHHRVPDLVHGHLRFSRTFRP